ncbi:MAG: ABC transporter substrate-binding protein [Propionibacteriaceae bacterium]
MPTSPVNRRTFLAITGLAASALTLSACSGPSTSKNHASPAPDIEWTHVTPATEISFWSNHPGKSKDSEAKLLAKFTEKTGIKVNHVTAGANYEEIAQKFQAAQQGKQPLPAVVVLSDVWWFRYFTNNSIIALDSVMAKLSFATNDYRKTLLADYQYSGKQWAIPYARSTPLFYYNKKHWAAAGLPDRAPKTWQELSEWAPKLRQANPDTPVVYMMPASSDYDSWQLQNKLWGWGAELSHGWDITLDSAAAVECISWFSDAVRTKKWAATSSKDNTVDFGAGIASCITQSTGSLVGVLKGAQNFEVGVGFLPGGPKNTDPVCPTGGAGLGIAKDLPAEQQLAGAMLIQFMTDAENSATFAEATGYMPVRESSDLSKLFATRPQAKVAIDQLAHTRSQDQARVFLPGADREIGMAIDKIMAQGADIAKTMADTKKKLETIYSTEVKPKLG